MRMRVALFSMAPVVLGSLLVAGCSKRSATPPVAFTDGVASGDVTQHAAMLWTRVNREATLVVQVATDPFFEDVVVEDTAVAADADDFTARVVARALEPGTTYYYRWRADTRTSEPGMFRTAPLPSVAADVRFAYSGDSDGSMIQGDAYYGPFQVLDAIRYDKPDFFVYLGDTIYADSYIRRQYHGIRLTTTLDGYRDMYRTNRAFHSLRALLASLSTYAMWDDHEVVNNFSGQTVSPALYANAREAFLEYMPVRTDALPHDPRCAGPPLFRRFRWGALVEIFIPDLRSCRSPDVEEICDVDLAPTLPPKSRVALGLTPAPPPGCLEAIFDPSRTMLGSVQKERIMAALASSTARLKLVLNEVPIQQLYADPYDRWEGFAAERNELLSFIRTEGIDGVVFLTTDLHANLVNQVAIDRFDDPTPIAQELVTGPIATRTNRIEIIDKYGLSGLAKYHDVLDLVDVDCRHLDIYSYGLVEVDASRKLATITLQDERGTVIHDERDPSVPCVHTMTW